MARHEGCAKAGREGRGRLRHADFGARDARGIARQEVVHRLFGRQPRDRRQHAISVGGEEDDILRDRPQILLRCIRDEVDRVGTAAIFGEAVVIQVDGAGFLVHHDIFQHRAEPLGGGEDFRFGLGRQVDHLGIAAALEIEDRRVRPAMFVVTDQRAAGVRRQRGLAGATEAEEHRRIAVRADIGRTMHRHHTLGRQQIVEDAEHALLHFAGIGGAADQDQLFGQVDRDHRFAAAAMARGIGAEAGQVDDRIFRRKPAQFFSARPHQQRADEQIVPGKFVDDAHIDAVLRLRPAKQVGDVERLLFAQRLEEIVLQCGEMLRRHRDIGVAPPDGAFGFGVADDELVLGAAAGMLAGLDDQRAVLRQFALAIAHGRFDQRRGAEIPMLGGMSSDALVRQGDRGFGLHAFAPEYVVARPYDQDDGRSGSPATRRFTAWRPACRQGWA